MSPSPIDQADVIRYSKALNDRERLFDFRLSKVEEAVDRSAQVIERMNKRMERLGIWILSTLGAGTVAYLVKVLWAARTP